MLFQERGGVLTLLPAVARAVLEVLKLLVLSLRGPSLLLCTGVDAALLLRVDAVLVLLGLLRRLKLLLLVLLCLGVLLQEGGLLMRDAVGWGLLGCRGCFAGCLLPLLITLNTGPLAEPEDFHLLELLLLLVLAGSGGDGLALMFSTGVHARCPDWGGVDSFPEAVSRCSCCCAAAVTLCLLDEVGCMNLGSADGGR